MKARLVSEDLRVLGEGGVGWLGCGGAHRAPQTHLCGGGIMSVTSTHWSLPDRPGQLSLG